MFNYVTIFVIAYLLVLTTKFKNVNCLYEDQAGIWDWKQSYIGKIKFFHSLSLSRSQTNLIGSESNVISSIHLRNGTIKWRTPMETNGDLQAFAIDDEQDGLNLDEYSTKELITVSSNGGFVRSWHPVTGALNWQKRMIERIRFKHYLLNFLVNFKQNEILASKFFLNNDNKLMHHFYAYDYVKEEFKLIEKSELNHHLKDLNSCKFVSSKSVVCLSVSNSTLNLYSLGQNQHAVKLEQFGVKENSNLELVLLDYQTNEENPMFALNLGKGSFALIKIVNNKLTLLKTFNNISSLTLKKVTINGILKTFLFALVPRTEESKDKTQHQFKVAAYDLVEWNEVKNLQEHFSLKYKGDLLVEKFYILPFNKAQDKFQYKIVLITKDASFILISSTQGTSKINWIREEALANVISAEIIDYPLNDLDAEIESLDLIHTDIYGQFVKRIKTQVVQLQTLVSNLIANLNDFISKPNKENKDLNDDLNLDYALYDENNQISIRDSFGFHKLIVALTKYGKLFGIDTLKGKIIWSLVDENLQKHLQDYLKEDENKKVPILIQRTTSHHPFQAVGTIVLKNGYIISIDLIKGEIISQKNLNINLKQIMLLNNLDSNNLKGILLFDESNTAHFYPPTVYEEVFLEHKDKYYLVTADSKTGIVEGYSFKNLDKSNRKANKIWSISIPISSEENSLKVIFKNPLEQVHSLGRVLGKY